MRLLFGKSLEILVSSKWSGIRAVTLIKREELFQIVLLSNISMTSMQVRLIQMNIQYRILFFIYLFLLSETPSVLCLALPGLVSAPVLASNSVTASAKNILTAASVVPRVGGRALGPDTRAAIVLKVARVAIAGRGETGWEHAGLMEPSVVRSDGWESAARVDLEHKSIVVPFDEETVRQGEGSCSTYYLIEFM